MRKLIRKCSINHEPNKILRFYKPKPFCLPSHFAFALFQYSYQNDPVGLSQIKICISLPWSVSPYLVCIPFVLWPHFFLLSCLLSLVRSHELRTFLLFLELERYNLHPPLPPAPTSQTLCNWCADGASLGTPFDLFTSQFAPYFLEVFTFMSVHLSDFL